MNDYGAYQKLMEQQRFLKFIRYCQMEGLGSVAAEEDRLYTQQQERFFQQYEQQLVTDAYLAGLLAEVLHEKV
jgi:hypothetical protein